MRGRLLKVARVVLGVFLVPALWLVFSTAQQMRAEAGSGSIGGILTLAGAVASCFWLPFVLAVRGRVPMAAAATVVAVLLGLVIAAYVHADFYGAASDNIAFLLFFAALGAGGATLLSRAGRKYFGAS